MDPITRLTTTLTLGKPQHGGRLTIVPLLQAQPSALAYLCFGEALQQGVVEVTELGPGGSVPEVQVHNRAPLPILFLDGEALVGAKQNRVLNLSVLVPAKSTTVIPVSCVEAGRWSPRTRAFSEGEALHVAGARACKVASVTRNMAAGSGRRSNQQEVWDDMAHFCRDVDAEAPTGAMQDAYTKVQQPVETMLAAFECLPGQVGAAFLLDGELVGLDALSSPRALQQVFGKIARSYAVEAQRGRGIGAAPAAGDRDVANAEAAAAIVAEALKRLAGEGWTSHPAIGMGVDARLAATGWDAAALAHEGELVHLVAFPRGRRGGGDAKLRWPFNW